MKNDWMTALQPVCRMMMVDHGGLFFFGIKKNNFNSDFSRRCGVSLNWGAYQLYATSSVTRFSLRIYVLLNYKQQMSTRDIIEWQITKKTAFNINFNTIWCFIKQITWRVFRWSLNTVRITRLRKSKQIKIFEMVMCGFQF